jgi:hypothetical protein
LLTFVSGAACKEQGASLFAIAAVIPPELAKCLTKSSKEGLIQFVNIVKGLQARVTEGEKLESILSFIIDEVYAPPCKEEAKTAEAEEEQDKGKARKVDSSEGSDNLAELKRQAIEFEEEEGENNEVAAKFLDWVYLQGKEDERYARSLSLSLSLSLCLSAHQLLQSEQRSRQQGQTGRHPGHHSPVQRS